MQTVVDQEVERRKEEARSIAKDFVDDPHLGRATLYCWASEDKGPGNEHVLEPGRYSEAERIEIYEAGATLLEHHEGGLICPDPECFCDEAL